MNPAALFLCVRIDFPEGRPESKAAVAYGKGRTFLKAPVLEIG
jgi:hypothetical protein